MTPSPTTPARRPAALALLLAAVLAAALLVGTAPSGRAASDPAVGAGVSAGVGDRANPPIRLTPGWKKRYRTNDPTVGLLRASVAAARTGKPVPSRLRPTLGQVDGSVADLGRCNYGRDGLERLCKRGDKDGTKTLVVYGNSHGRHWIDAFERLARKRGWQAYYLVKPQCLAALVTPDERGGRPNTGCADFHDFAMASIADLEPDLVVVSSSGSRGTVYDAQGNHITAPAAVRRAIYRGHLALFRQLKASAGRTVLLEDVPELAADPNACLRRGGSLRSCLGHVARSSLPEVRDQNKAARQSKVRVVTTHQWFCWQGDCPAVVGGYLPYRDGEHIPNPYSASLADSLARRLGIR